MVVLLTATDHAVWVYVANIYADKSHTVSRRAQVLADAPTGM